jgi:DNA-binding MarR family transcriptional regulator
MPQQSRVDHAARIGRLADIIMVLQRSFIQRLSEQLAHGRVSFAQYFLLTHVSAGGSLTMSAIAEKMSHSTAAATGLVDRLENLGYVRRAAVAGDRRKVLVQITRKGLRLVEKIREDIIGNLDELMHELTEDEQRAWLEIYEKIHAYCTACSLSDLKK